MKILEAWPGIEPGCKDLQAATCRAFSNASPQTGANSDRLKSKAWERRANQSAPPERKNPATAGTVHGAFGNPDPGGSGQREAYRKGGSVATILRSVFNDDGHFVGLEVAR